MKILLLIEHTNIAFSHLKFIVMQNIIHTFILFSKLILLRNAFNFNSLLNIVFDFWL